MTRARALSVLGEVLDPEAREERAQVGLDGVDREVDLVGDLLVGGGRRELGVLVGPAERDEHLALGGGELGEGGQARATVACESDSVGAR